MTKFSLALAAGVSALALSTAAMAQTTGGNTVYTNQDGGDTATITQSGTNGYVGFRDDLRVQQLGGNGSGNSLVVNQGGDGNVVGATSFTTPVSLSNGSNYGADQTGSGNTLRIDQTGTNNQVSFKQEGNNNGNVPAQDGGSGANGMSPYQAGYAYNNYGGGSAYGGASPTGFWNYVSQSGNDNQLALVQNATNGGRGAVIAYQGGNLNVRAGITQNTNAAGVNYAYLNQNGTNGQATINQTLSADGNNVADVRQADSNANSNNSTATVTQTGYNLDSYVNQQGSYNTATTFQSGSGSTAIVFQVGGGTSALTGNTLLSNQYGDSNRMTAYQIGNTNSITSNQGTLSGDLGSHQLLAFQNGSNLSIDSTQVGFNQYAIVDQIGSYSQYVGNQSGSSNRADVAQGGGSVGMINVANVLQSGTNNQTTIRQNR